MAEFVPTNRGGKILQYQGYAYTKIREGKGGMIFWRCQEHKSGGCEARASSEDTSVVVRNQHNHPPDQASMKSRKLVDKMRKRAREESTSLNRIYDDTLEEVSQESGSDAIISKFPSLYSIKSSLYRSRRERLPPMPKTC